MAANTTLNMDTTAIGYSQEGINSLKTKISTEISSAISLFSPTRNAKSWTDLKETLDDYWDGNDYKRFITDLEEMATALAKELYNYNKTLSESLDQYAKQFAAFQNSNYTAGQIKLKK